MPWDGNTYRQHSMHHRRLDDWFLARFPLDRASYVLDVGCGSGEFTKRLAASMPSGHVVGADIDDSMLAAAKTEHTLPNLSFIRAKAQDITNYYSPETFDAVVSRAAFHWIPSNEWKATYQAVFSILKPSGWFYAESAGAGNAEALGAVAKELCLKYGLPQPVLYHPSLQDLLPLIRDVGFDAPYEHSVTSIAQWRPMDREDVKGLLQTQLLRSTGKEMDRSVQQRFLNDVDEAAQSLRREDGSYDQPFVRVVVLLQRPS